MGTNIHTLRDVEAHSLQAILLIFHMIIMFIMLIGKTSAIHLYTFILLVYLYRYSFDLKSNK